MKKIIITIIIITLILFSGCSIEKGVYEFEYYNNKLEVIGLEKYTYTTNQSLSSSFGCSKNAPYQTEFMQIYRVENNSKIWLKQMKCK